MCRDLQLNSFRQEVVHTYIVCVCVGCGIPQFLASEICSLFFQPSRDGDRETDADSRQNKTWMEKETFWEREEKEKKIWKFMS